MAYVVPNSTVYLIKNIKITPNYSDTIYFSTRAAQETYFTDGAKRVATLTAQSYQRHSRGWLKVKLPLGTVAQANYMMFKNTTFENKWFYAFITDWEYVNDNTTLISYAVDDIQTWFFDCTLGDCFVEREHAMNDAIGANRIPEPVGSDRVMMVERWVLSDMNDYSVVIQASQKNRSGSVWSNDYLHHGMFNGLDIAVEPINDGNDASAIAQVLNDMVGDGSYAEDATNQQQVVSVIMFPSRFTNEQVVETPPYSKPFTVNEGFTDNRNNLNGYVPRNKKLLTAPFKKLLLTNGIGANETLDYDEFISPQGVKQSPAFEVMGTYNGSGQLVCTPFNYRGVTRNFDFKLVINEFPQCGYTLDSYRAWLAGGGDIKQKVAVLQGIGNGIFGLTGIAQGASNAYQKQWNENYDARYNQSTAGKNLNQGALNAVNVGATNYANKETSVVDAIAGSLSGVGGLLSGVLNTYTDYKTTEFDSHAQSNVPVGMTAGNTMVGSRELNFRCYDVDINATDAQIIDEFFDKYGYQTNRLKVPNISGRKQWNYIKTRDCEIVGNIPASIKASIIDIFNSGITFWKHGDNIGNYSLDNTLT
jgi:hypothetical protein